MFKHLAKIYLRHTDAAGRLYFVNQFDLAHEAKESFLESIGLPIDEILDDATITFPVVHAEADFKKILKAGDKIEIEVFVEKLGETSVTFGYHFYNKSAELAGTARIVNVCVDKRSWAKIPLPEKWREKLSASLKV